jgi:molybdopterin molybdotransferase
MIPLSDARQKIQKELAPLPAQTGVWGALHGRVLRQDISAPEDLPGFNRSAMDGYALNAEDQGERFEVRGEIQPGAAAPQDPAPGQCFRVYTGAALPAGCSEVIPQEAVHREGDWIVPKERFGGTHVRRRGEDARAGTVLLRAGTVLRAPQVSLLAQLGAVAPQIAPRPRVIHLVTGNELVPPGTMPGPGEIRDSNSSLVAGLVEAAGGEIVWQGRVSDRLEAFVETVEGVDIPWDLLLISGGASVGDYDFGPRALQALGFDLRFHGVRLRPGKPVGFATRGPQAAFLLPGNPVSHWVVFEVAVRLALERLLGAVPAWEFVPALLAEDLPGKLDRRETFWPGRLRVGNSGLEAVPLGWRSSGDLCGVAGAGVLLWLPAESGPWKSGDPVKCLLLKERGLRLD